MWVHRNSGSVFFANDITDAKKKTAIFLTVTGSETCSLLIILLSPETPPAKAV